MKQSNCVASCIALGLVLALGGCGGGGGGGGNDGVISFVAASFRQNEDGTPGSAITLERVGGSGAVSVTLTFPGGTATGGSCATPGVDYDAGGGAIVVSWAAGDTSDKVVGLSICPDNLDEQPGETVDLLLTNPTGGAALGLAVAVLTINDDDEAGSIQFSAPTYAYLESGAVVMGPVTIQRVGGIDGAVSATITWTDGTANSDPLSLVEPVDYAPTTTTVTFADQDATDVVLAHGIVDDLLPEIDETFTIELGSPTNGVTIGSPSTAEVTIVDGDMLLEIPNPVDELNGFFGSSVAKIGARLAVGAPGSNPPSGRVRIFDMFTDPMTDPTQVGGDLSRPFAQHFGAVLAPDGLDLLVGSSAGAWIFDEPVYDPGLAFTSGLDGFGRSLTSLGDGRIVIGAPLANGGNGAFDVYDGVLGGFLQSIAGKSNEQFGADFAVGAPGLLVGAPGVLGSVHLFAGNPLTLALVINNPFPAGGLSHSFGAAVAFMGTTLIVGAPDEDTFAPNDGRVYLFDGATTTTVLPPNGVVPNGRFGAQILVIGNRICVQEQGGGLNGMGRVFVLDASGALVQEINGFPNAPAADFGAAMCEYDGALVIGVPKFPFLLQSGSVFVVKLL